jgi:hypothetical protein
MQDFSAEILFKAEADAESFDQRVVAQLGATDSYFDKVLQSLGASLPGARNEFSVERFRRYRNVVSVQFYAGNRSEYRPILSALFQLGAHMVKLHVGADDYNEVELYADGKQTKKKAIFLKEFQSIALPDPTSDFQRALANRNFKRAEALIPQIDVARVTLDDEILEGLMLREASTIALYLIEQGVIRENRRIGQYPAPLTIRAAYWCNLPVLKALCALGFDPYETNTDGETVLHIVLSSAEFEAIETCRWVVERCKSNLNPVTQCGSPIWHSFESDGYSLLARIFREQGALLIAPEGFYENLSRDEVVVESAKHNDVDTLKTQYQDQDRVAVLCTAVEHAALDVIVWMNDRQSIDWFSEVKSVNGRSDDPPLPLYEQPFQSWDGGNTDLVFLDHLINEIASSVEALDRVAVYISGRSETAPLLRKLHQLGSTLGQVTLCNGDSIFPLWRAMTEGRVDNARTLLELGAPIPDEVGGEPLAETFAEQAMNYHDDVDPAAWEALFKQYGLL